MQLSVENLQVSYGKIKALHGLNFISIKVKLSPLSVPMAPARARP
jgi:ABC-type branched-subunit amino acid transport system ATPase component